MSTYRGITKCQRKKLDLDKKKDAKDGGKKEKKRVHQNDITSFCTKKVKAIDTSVDIVNTQSISIVIHEKWDIFQSIENDIQTEGNVTSEAI